MTSGRATAMVQNRRNGRSVRTVRKASGTPMQIDAPVTAATRPRLVNRISTVIGRATIDSA